MIRKFLFFTTLFLLVFGGGKAWAQSETTLVDFDFTKKADFPNSTAFSNTGETKMAVDEHDIFFYHNNTSKSTFSLTDAGLTFGDNNMSSNYFVAIPLTGIKGEITVTFYHDYTSTNAGYRYQLKDGTTSYSPSDASSSSTAKGAQPSITKTITVNSGDAVFYFGRNGSSYTNIKGIKITTPTSASKPKLSVFDFNNDDILYYLNTSSNSAAGRTAATSVSTTFEKNSDYGENGYLRVKVNIEPDFATLTNPTFTISSSNTSVLSTEGVTAYYKATTNRMYIDGVKVVGTGTATLTVNFTGSENYDGTATTTSGTITVNAATAPTLSLTTPTSTTNAEIGNIIELTANKAFSLVEGQYTTTDGVNYISGTINENPVTFAVDLTKQTLTHTMGTTFAPNTLYEIVIPAGKIQSSGVSNAAQTLSFTTGSGATLTQVSEKLWDFEEADGFPASQIAEIAVIDNMELVANSSKKMSFDNVAKSYTEGSYSFTRQLKFGGTYASDGSNRIIHFKVAAGSTVNVFGSTGSNGSERTAAIRVAAKDGKFSAGKEKATLTSSTSELVKGSFTIDAENYPNGAEVWVYSKNSGFNLSGIEVTTSKPKLTLSNTGQATSYAYSGSGEDSKDYEITYSYSGDTNLTSDDKGNFSVTSSDEAIIKATGATITLDVTNKKFTITGLKVKSAGTATLTFKFAGNETYAESSLVVPFTVTGKLPFSIKLEDLNIQQRQRRTIMPVITNASGNPIGFDASDNVIEMADDDDPVDYDTYFDFTYSLGSNDIGVTIDGNVVRAGDQTGGPVPVTVTATPKPAYTEKFTNGTASGTLNVTVTDRTTGLYFDFYLDKECTTKVDDVYGTSLDGSTTVVEDFPNGRVLYLKLNDAGVAQNIQEIWFSTGKNTTPIAVSRYVRDGEARTIYKDDPSKSQYLYKMDGGSLPIYIDGDLDANPYVYVNVQCYKEVAGSIEQAGSVIPVKFNIVSHTRPENVTYDPESDGNLVRNTSQAVVAVGTSGNTPKNQVYGKFSSTGTNYTIEGLLNEPHVIYGVERTGVFSTEVGPRKISGVQIQSNYGDNGDYVSAMTTMTYQYRFATTLNVNPKTITVRVGHSEDFELPATKTATYYDKVQKKDIDMSTAEKGAVYTYSVVSNTTTATQTTFASDGTITLGNTPGTVVLSVNYDNETSITVNKRTSRMDVATATYIVNIIDENQYLPTITPATKKYYNSFNATVKAHDDYAAYYTTDGSDPSESSTRFSLAKGESVSVPIPENVDVGTVKTIKAVSIYAGPTYSSIVQESYTKGDIVLPPYFVPSGDGAAPDYGTYNYYTETLGVEARTNTAGASIYYTLDGSEPEIGGATTYLYDGLRGITISGNVNIVNIKAFAYKDGIQSETVISRYAYGSIEPPYFSVDGSGKYTLGSQAVTTSNVITIGSDVVPSTGTTLRHYYTLDGSDPGEDGGTLYTAGFTLVKTVTAKAYSVLVDASGNEVQQSSVTTVEFTITSPLDVWEAVAETTPDGKMQAADGFIISRDNDIVSLYSSNDNNAETKVNLNSLNSSFSGGTASKIYAQEFITVTFGGYEVSGKGKNWTSMTIADPAIGSPIDGVGAYNIAGPDNAKVEVKNSALADPTDNYNHIYSELQTTHEKTFHLPCKGAFVKFEPEKDGEVTIWALQHGSLNYNEGITLCDKFIRYRPVYFVDEQGKSYPVKEVNGVPQLWSSARLSAEWAKIEATAASNSWTGWKESQTIIHNGVSTDIENKGLNASESQALYNLYKKYITDNNIKIGDPIKPFPVHNGSTISTNNGNYTDRSNDGTGYVMLTGGYVKYTFEVKAGKTYYFFGQGTKIGIRGFRFKPTESGSRPMITFHANSTEDASTVKVNDEVQEQDLATVLSTYRNTTVNVKVERNFSNHWAAIALPFSVSATQMEKVFGAGTEISHFRDIINSGRTIAFRHHKNQMLVAGTPAIIYPTNTDMSSVTFEGVQLEADAVEKMTGDCDDFSMIGTFVRQPANTDYSLNRYDYYFGANDGVIYRFNNSDSEKSSQAIQGTRAWLRPKDPEASSARMLSVGFEEVDDDEYTTGIIEITDDGLGERSKAKGAIGIYNLKGQKVGEGSLEGLAKGVYIINGKKMVVE